VRTEGGQGVADGEAVAVEETGLLAQCVIDLYDERCLDEVESLNRRSGEGIANALPRFRPEGVVGHGVAVEHAVLLSGLSEFSGVEP
jgi:hypothetical protein